MIHTGLPARAQSLETPLESRIPNTNSKHQFVFKRCACDCQSPAGSLIVHLWRADQSEINELPAMNLRPAGFMK